MTKKELLEGIKAKSNPTEFETLGLSLSDSKEKLQEIYDAYSVIEKNPEYKEPDINKSETREAPPEDLLEIDEEKKSEETTGEDYNELLSKVNDASASQHEVTETEEPKEPVTRTRRKNKKGASSPDSFHVSGYILMLAVDTVYPNALAFINNMIDKKHDKVDPGMLRLSQKDMDELEPLADQAADYLTFNVNPVVGFFLAATFLYTNNIIAVKAGFVTKK